MRKSKIDRPVKILISSEGPELKSQIAHRFGTSSWFLVVNLKTMVIEVLPNPGASGQKGGGMQAVALAIEMKVEAIVTGYCSPMVEKYLKADGIEVFQGFQGTAADVIRQFEKKNLSSHSLSSIMPVRSKNSLRVSLVQTFQQFGSMIPLIFGVVGLIGLFNIFIPGTFLSSVFSGNRELDTFWGACFGSILMGNPINSYIIGGSLLEKGVSLSGVTAFIVTWVSVGVLQLPMETGILGKRFAIARNLLSFLMAMVVAFLTVACLEFFAGRIF